MSDRCFIFFFFKQKTAYEIGVRLVGSEMCIRDSTCTVPFSLVNGWHSAITNVPDAAKGKYSILLNIWEYGPSSTGNLTNSHMQALIIEKGGGIFTRLYINSAWSDWA